MQPSAVACDEAPDTCFAGDPSDESGGEAGCEAHLVNHHLDLWMECRVGFSPMSMHYVAGDQAPELSPNAFVEVSVVITRMGPTGTDEPWGLRIQEGVPGVIIDGAAYYSGTLASGETSVSFSFNLSADPSVEIDEAVVGVAFWDSEHKPKYGYLAFTVEDEILVPIEWVAWGAFFMALLALIIALILAMAAMRRRKTP